MCASSGPRSAKGGAGEATATGSNPTDRGKPGTKRHLLTEGAGILIAVLVTGANGHDMKKLAALLGATVITPAPADDVQVVLDRGYDYPYCRAAVIARGYAPHIPLKASAATPLPPSGDPTRHLPRCWVAEGGAAGLDSPIMETGLIYIRPRDVFSARFNPGRARFRWFEYLLWRFDQSHIDAA